MSQNFYEDSERYDVVMGAYASGEALAFYQRQIARYGEPVLELACGSGRLTIPLAEAGVNITGLDLAPAMLRLAQEKAAGRGVTLPWIEGDMCHFDLPQKFQLIFIAAQSLTHLHTRPELEACFSAVRRHLAPDGRFLIELFNPSLTLLSREPHQRYRVGQYITPAGLVTVEEEVQYNSVTQVNQIRWFYQTAGETEEVVLNFAMRQFFPREIDHLLWYNGFTVEHKYGWYDETVCTTDSHKQLIVAMLTP